MAYLWAEHDEASARHRLADSVYVLRKALGDEAVQASGEYLRLNAAIVGTDIADFAAALEEGDLVQAADLYAGPFMDGFYVTGAAEFEDWIESERRRLANQYEETLESLAEAAEEAEDHTRASGWWRRLTAHDAYNSRFTLRLMESLAAAGDHANAVQLAREHERVLREDLGVEPPAEVVDLAERLARQQAEVSEVIGEPWPERELGSTELEGGRRAAVRPRPFVTWRTAVVSLSIALALCGVIVAGWIVLGGTGYLLFRGAAAGFVEPEDCVVVAEFESETERPATGLAVRDQVVADLSRPGYVTVLGLSQVRETLRLMRLPDTTRVDETLALEIARRDNCPAVVSGSVASLGTGYSLTAVIIEAESGAALVRPSETAADDTELIPAVERLARKVRRHLGESLPSIGRSAPLARYTTSSLEALEFFTLAIRRAEQGGDYAAAVPLLEQAVALDSTFAEAHRKLAAYYPRYPGKRDAANRSLELAYHHSERLPLAEQLGIAALYHGYRGRQDSALHYYRRILERYPNDGVAAHNGGLILAAMGRFEEALELFRALSEVDPLEASARDELIVTARILGRHALADSALAIVREITGRSHLNFEAGNAFYRGDLAAVDSLARELEKARESEKDPSLVSAGQSWRAALAAMYGRMNAAHVLAQATGPDRRLLRFVELASFVAGTPERALPYVDSLRRQSPAYNPWDENERLGDLAYGYALAGDVRSAREILAVMDSVYESDGFHPSTGIGERVHALVALDEGRAEDAVEHLSRAREQSFGYLFWDARFFLAAAHAALGHLTEAIAQYDTVTSTYRMGNWYIMDFDYIYIYCALRPPAHERLGSLYLEAGDTVAAARHLAEFIDLWRDADPELQPRVEAARRLLAQLVPEETG
jgi:DNA-binding SARP family transcriptional activator